MQIRSLVWLVGLVGLLPPGPAPGAPAEDGLASFRAVYELTIDDSGGPVAAATAVGGRMVAEFVGSACGGYRSKMRIVTQGEDADGNAQITDARSDTLETADGRYEFTNQTFVNSAMAEESTGVASRETGGITVTLSKPGAKTVALDRNVVFPTEQMKKVLAAASGNQHFVAMDLFDGSDAGDTIYATAAVIGNVSSAPDDFGDETLIGEAGFGSLPHWPVTVSYFEKGKGTDDAPTYMTSFVVYSNGVGRKLRIDYGKFALNGRLTHLEILPTPRC